MQCYVSLQPPIYPPSRDQQHAHTSVLSPSLLPVRMPLSCGICPPSRPPAPCLTGKPSRCRSASRRPTDGWAGSLSESGQRCPLQRVLRRLWRWLLSLNLARNLGPKQWAVHWARWRQRRLRLLRAARMREPVYRRLSAPNPSLPAQIRTYDWDVSTRIKWFFFEVRLEFVLRDEINALVS